MTQKKTIKPNYNYSANKMEIQLIKTVPQIIFQY